MLDAGEVFLRSVCYNFPDFFCLDLSVHISSGSVFDVPERHSSVGTSGTSIDSILTSVSRGSLVTQLIVTNSRNTKYIQLHRQLDEDTQPVFGYLHISVPRPSVLWFFRSKFRVDRKGLVRLAVPSEIQAFPF